MLECSVMISESIDKRMSDNRSVEYTI